MKRMVTLLNVPAVLLLSSQLAMAASPDRRPSGGLAMWGFLAFCAIIVVAQLFPLLRYLGRQKAVTDNQPGVAALQPQEEKAGSHKSH